MNSAMRLGDVAGRSGQSWPPTTSTHNPRSSGSPFVTPGNSGGRFRFHHKTRRGNSAVKFYQLTDRLHTEHTVLVPGDEIAATVPAWLARLDAASPLVDDLAHAIQIGDWPTTYAIGAKLSVAVSVAAQPI